MTSLFKVLEKTVYTFAQTVHRPGYRACSQWRFKRVDLGELIEAQKEVPISKSRGANK